MTMTHSGTWRSKRSGSWNGFSLGIESNISRAPPRAVTIGYLHVFFPLPLGPAAQPPPPGPSPPTARPVGTRRPTRPPQPGPANRAAGPPTPARTKPTPTPAGRALGGKGRGEAVG